MDVLRLAIIAVLVPALPGLPPRAGGEPPTTTPSPRPIAESVERVIDRIEEERKDPCLKAARENVPCFPVKTEERGFDASVRESLGILGPVEKPSRDRPPTRDELGPYRPGSTTPTVGVTVDPVCIGKSALKRLKGKNDVYYLYRVRDAHGERVVLYDHRLDASRFQGDIAFLGRFDGDCEAQAAYRREQRRTTPVASPPLP